jgi:hypothetical protein
MLLKLHAMTSYEKFENSLQLAKKVGSADVTTQISLCYYKDGFELPELCHLFITKQETLYVADWYRFSGCYSCLSRTHPLF